MVSPSSYNDHIAHLKLLGAADSAHVKDSLLSHLEGTCALLQQWGDRDALCLSGLYHAVYSTHGFTQSLMDANDREPLRAMIGEEAENIVYLFCACDRKQFYPQIGRCERPLLHNRFTGQDEELEPSQLRDMLELTLANELQITRDQPDHHHEVSATPPVKTLRSRTGALLRAMKLLPPRESPLAAFEELFERCMPFVSQPAARCFYETFKLPHPEEPANPPA